MNNESDDFQVIDSQYELIESTRVEEGNKGTNDDLYQVTITPTKNQVDLNFMENQYYLFQVVRKINGQLFAKVERRFSQFQLMFQILEKKEGGFIFPAFPANGLFAFMKSKVSLSKDEQFVKRRTKMIARFFNKIINNPLFDPQHCSEMKIFLSPGKQFEARKQIEKGSSKGYFNLGWNKLKTYFVLGKQNKFSDPQSRISHLKGLLQTLYTKCRQLMQCIKQEQVQTSILLSHPISSHKLFHFGQMMQKHDKSQQQNMKKLEDIQFQLFCENEDLQMVTRIFDRINELKDDEDNYAQLKNIQQKLQQRLEQLIAQKSKSKKSLSLQLRWAIAEIKTVGRIQD